MIPDLIQLAEFFRDSFTKAKDDKTRRALVQVQIQQELHFDLEILDLMRQKHYSERPETWPRLLSRLSTTSYDSLLLAGIRPEQVMEDSLSADYLYIMRKVAMLRLCAEGGGDLLEGLKLHTRIGNISRAMRRVLEGMELT